MERRRAGYGGRRGLEQGVPEVPHGEASASRLCCRDRQRAGLVRDHDCNTAVGLVGVGAGATHSQVLPSTRSGCGGRLVPGWLGEVGRQDDGIES